MVSTFSQHLQGSGKIVLIMAISGTTPHGKYPYPLSNVRAYLTVMRIPVSSEQPLRSGCPTWMM